MNRVSLAGVAVGNLIDVASTFIAVFLAGLLVFFYYAFEYQQAISASFLEQSGAFMAGSMVLGSLFSILAGYVSARIARRDEILNGALSSVICVGLGAYGLLSGGVTHYFALQVILIPVSLALSAFGGYLRFRQIN